MWQLAPTKACQPQRCGERACQLSSGSGSRAQDVPCDTAKKLLVENASSDSRNSR